MGLESIAKDYKAFHDAGFEEEEVSDLLPYIGQFSYRKDGEKHAWNPDSRGKSLYVNKFEMVISFYDLS